MKKKLVGVLSLPMLLIVPALCIAASMAGSNTVNSAAIVDGAVATVDIANKAVTGAKIADATITATQLASGAVTDAKIGGQISTSKLKVGTSAGTVAAGDHTHDVVYSKKYANIIVVAKSGGDFTDPVAAMNSIADASSTNPYLVKVMPGVYNVGSSSVNMKQYVDIEGSGENVTKITGAVGKAGGNGFSAGVVNGSSNAELRFITVENFSGNYGSAINNYGASPKISHVTAISYDSTMSVNFGIMNDNNSSPIIDDATIIVSGNCATGIYTYKNSNLVISNSNISASSAGVGTCGVMGVTNILSALTLNNVNLNVTTTVDTSLIGIHNYISDDSVPTTLKVNSSKINVNGAPRGNVGIQSNGKAIITNSEVSANFDGAQAYPWPSYGVNDDGVGNTYIFNSIVSGSSVNVNGVAKCVNTIDSSFAPVVCQ